MDPDISRITSLATTIEEVTRQLGEIAERHRGGAQEELTTALDEVERSLRAASRRLERLARSLA